MRYRIEQLCDDGRWFIRGSERYKHDARYHARRYASEDNVTTRVTDALEAREALRVHAGIIVR